VAVRGLHVGRYGQDAEHERLLGYDLGYPELVHGYSTGSFAANECAGLARAECLAVDSLIGSRLLVANLEVRAPLVGLFRGDISYGPVPVEIAAFFDAGVAWTRDSRPAFAGGTREWVRSAGAAARLNAFGLLIIEVAAAKPLDRIDRSWQWQVGIRQGF
jgi:outer membrane protein assembly factor BamA